MLTAEYSAMLRCCKPRLLASDAVGFPHQLSEFPFPSQLGGTLYSSGARTYTGTCSVLPKWCALEYFNQTGNLAQ